MAPPKANLPARLATAGDLFGLNWTKVTWMAPYNNFYPITLSGGHGNRLWSSFIQYGHFHNRTTHINLRNLILAGPSVFMGLVMLFNVDWYQLMQCLYIPMQWEMPQWAEDKHAAEMLALSWFKPGAMTKHHFAGMVSIPNSDQLVKEL